jgi:ribosomal protein L44E
MEDLGQGCQHCRHHTLHYREQHATFKDGELLCPTGYVSWMWQGEPTVAQSPVLHCRSCGRANQRA